MVEALFEIFERGFYILSVALAWGCHVDALGPTQAVTTQKTFRLGSAVVNNSWSRITGASHVAAFGQGSSRPYTIVPLRLANRGLQCRRLLRWVGAPPVDSSSARSLASLRPCRLLLEWGPISKN